MPLAANQHLFEYRIARVLGQGAFGTVYLAHDMLLDRPVAIKELTITAQTDEVAFKRFIQEARVAGGLNHPHVVTVYALKVVEPNVYLVMEYLAGGSLRALLEERGPLPVEQAVRIAAEVCEGLAAAHAKDIVHRDVKPESILLADDVRAKVGDFGIAHVPRGAGGTYLSQLTGTGFQPGTLLYMSPEQIRGQQVDGRSDVYQVGALLYEMLTGWHYVDMDALGQQARETAGSNVVLFQARLYELLAEAVCQRGLESVCQACPEVPGWVGEVVMVAMAKEAGGRPHAGELAQALRSEKVVHITQGESFDAADIALAKEHFNRATDLTFGKKWEQAAEELKCAIGIYPKYAEAYLELGKIFLEMKAFDKAQEAYQQATAVDPTFPQGYIELAELYEQQGAYDLAASTLQQAIRVDADSVRSHYYFDMHWHSGACYLKILSAYQKAVAVNPNSAEIHYNLGRVLAVDSNLSEALVEHQRAVSLRPNYTESFVAIGEAYLELDQPEQALSAFRQAVGMEWPEQEDSLLYLSSLGRGSFGRGDAYMGLAKAYIKLGKFDQANATVELALEITPEASFSMVECWIEAYQDQGRSYLDQDRCDLAVAAFLQAVNIYSLIPTEKMIPHDLFNRALAYLWVATSYYRLGLQRLDQRAYEEAGHFLDRALEAWETGYSILPSPDKEDPKIQEMWIDEQLQIESARGRAKRLFK